MNIAMPTSAHKINGNKYSRYGNGGPRQSTLNGCPELPIAPASFNSTKKILIFALANMTE